MAKGKIKNNLTSIAIKFFFLFGISSVLGGLIGKLIDKKFDVAPYGTLAIFFLFYIMNWVIIWRVYKHFQSVQDEEQEEDSSDTEISEDKNN